MNPPAQVVRLKRATPNRAFPTTQWSIIRMATEGVEAENALDALCQRYWFPVYGFIRRQGRSHHEAEDLTQEFIARLIENQRLGRARPELGRFRTFLLTSLRNFLINEWHRAKTERRGGLLSAPPLSLEFGVAEDRFRREPADAGLTPEAAFDRAWALEVMERALASLKREYTSSGRGPLFEAVAPIVWGGGKSEPLAVSAERLKLNEGALKVAVHRLRKRLREEVETVIADTVANPEEMADEVRYLISALSTRL